MTAIDYTPILCFLALIFLTLWTLRQVKLFHESPETAERIDRRLSAEEMRLTGEDWRDNVAEYFGKRANHEAIVRDVTGCD